MIDLVKAEGSRATFAHNCKAIRHKWGLSMWSLHWRELTPEGGYASRNLQVRECDLMNTIAELPSSRMTVYAEPM